jgi:type II secretory pathway component GspD/PulD (secretin)
MFIIHKKKVSALLMAGIFILLFAGIAAYAAELSAKESAVSLISLDLKNADLEDVLRLLAHQNNLSLVLTDQVRGKRGTFYYVKVPLQDALDNILAGTGFKYNYNENTRTVQILAVDPAKLDTRIFILKYADPFNIQRLLEEEVSNVGRVQIDQDTNSLIVTDTFASFNRLTDMLNTLDVESSKTGILGEAEITEQGKSVMTNVFVLRYISAQQVKDIVTKLVTQTGTVEVDPLSNSLVVRDTPSVVTKIKGLIDKLDKETPQVMIDAEVVEITVGTITDLGVQWFYLGDKGTIGTMNYKYQTEPSPAGTINYGLSSRDTGGSLLFGEVTDKFRGVINALITDNKADLLANPRITVLNNEKANIEISEKFPYQQYSGRDQFGNPQYSTEFLDIGIILAVTPSIKEDIVTLDLAPQVSYTAGENAGIPIQALRKATTKVNVRNGKTIVIGGLLSNKKGKTAYKVPILGSIPLLGRLFRSDKDTIDKVELVIFVTPHILNQAKMEKIGSEERSKYK